MYTGYSNFHQNYFLQMIREYKGFLDHHLKFGSEKSRYVLRNNLNPKVEDQTTLTANYKKISTKSENDPNFDKYEMFTSEIFPKIKFSTFTSIKVIFKLLETS